MCLLSLLIYLMHPWWIRVLISVHICNATQLFTVELYANELWITMREPEDAADGLYADQHKRVMKK